MTDQEYTPTDDADGAGDVPGDWYAPEIATFGDRLAGARDAAGMTQAQLARRLGVRLETLRKWEQDLSEPRANKLQMLSGLLNVSLTWLLTAQGAGVDGPAEDGAPDGDDLGVLLTDLRQVKNDLTVSVQRVGLLEKRLRQVIERRTQ